MYPSFRDYFYFNKSERKGVAVLLVIITIIIIAKESLMYFNQEPILRDSGFDSLIAEIQQRIDLKDSIEKQEKARSDLYNVNLDSIDFYSFNPNQFPAEKWQQFGLTEKQSEVIKRYEAAGGNFRTKKDVKKMFVISDVLYSKLKKYILLPDSMIYSKRKDWDEKNTNKDKYEKKVSVKIDINDADTTEFKKLSGIGSVLSKRIVEYREKLGGFHSKEQLSNVYGLKSDVLVRLDTQLLFKKVPLRRLDINKATAEQLKEHPLIKWKIANSIVKYRKQHGNYKNIKEIMKSNLIDEELFKSLKPYIKVQGE